MRLSATDRIIREAQQHDSAAVEAQEDPHPDTEKVTAAPLFSLGIPSPRMPPMGGGFDLSLGGDELEDGEEEEGETQVDAKRLAAALDQMRGGPEGGPGRLQTLPPSPATPRPSAPYRGVPPGRPGGTASLALAPALAPLVSNASPTSTLVMFGRAGSMPAGAAPATARVTPSSPGQSSWQPEDVPAPAFLVPPPRQPRAVRTPTPSPVAAPAPAARSGVGRGAGFAIAGLTAIAVAVVTGAWTARDTGSAGPPFGPSTAMAPAVTTGASHPVVAAGPGPTAVAVAAPPSPAIEPIPPSAAPPVPVAETAPAAVTPPAAVEPTPPATASTETVAPPAPSKHARGAAKAAKVAKARPARKKAAIRRNDHAPRPARAIPTARTSAGHGAGGQPPGRGRTDPDDTLPISSD